MSTAKEDDKMTGVVVENEVSRAKAAQEMMESKLIKKGVIKSEVASGVIKMEDENNKRSRESKTVKEKEPHEVKTPGVNKPKTAVKAIQSSNPAATKDVAQKTKPEAATKQSVATERLYREHLSRVPPGISLRITAEE